MQRSTKLKPQSKLSHLSLTQSLSPQMLHTLENMLACLREQLWDLPSGKELVYQASMSATK